MGNPHYSSILEDTQFQETCLETDPEGYRILFPEESKDFPSDSQEMKENLDFSVVDERSLGGRESMEESETSGKKEKDQEEEEEEYIKNDSIAKSQFNYNKSTCFSHNHPEISVEENTSEPVQVAPGQGKIPHDLLQEENLDVKSFPCFFPDGKNGKDEKRPVTLQDQAYWEQRILNVDQRCGTCPPYVFMAAAHTELKQMNRNINMSFQRGLERVNPDGSCVYTLDGPYNGP